DARGEQADGASIGAVEAGGKVARIIVAEQRRAQAIEALREDAAAMLALLRLEVHGEGDAHRRARRGDLEIAKGRYNLRRGAALVRLVRISTTERAGERYEHPLPPRATARLRGGALQRACQGKMAAKKGESARTRVAICSNRGWNALRVARRGVPSF